MFLTGTVCCLNDLGVGGGVVCLDVGVDGFLDHGRFELSLSQLAPHRRLVATLRKLISTVQVADVVDQNLRDLKRKHHQRGVNKLHFLITVEPPPPFCTTDTLGTT